MRRPLTAALAVCALAGAGCGSSSSDGGTATRTVERTTSRVDVVKGSGDAIDAAGIYRDESPGVVTVISILGRGVGQGSGFVISADGEIATNAHVVTDGQGASIKKADQVYVQFKNRDQVPAKVVGFDPNADVALLKIDPAGLSLRPLKFASLEETAVGQGVVAIGSPFGQVESLSVGVVSALDRSIDSLTGFQITGAIQTDAAINKGNSGGPLLNARGQVLGINSQIRTQSGDGSGVGFAVAANTIQHSLDALRKDGKVRYAFLGVQSTDVYPQLAKRFSLGSPKGAWVQGVTKGGPADDAGLRGPGGGSPVRFQAGRYVPGGDVITKIDGQSVSDASDLGQILQTYAPGRTAAIELFRDGRRKTVKVKLGERPVAPRG